MSAIPQLIYDTYISFYPAFLADDILVLFIGKLLVIFSVLVMFYAVFFYPLIFVIKLFTKSRYIRM